MTQKKDRRITQTEDAFIRDDLEKLKFAKNYNRWLYSLVEPFIGQRVLEIGPGIGNMTGLMLNHVDLLVGMEPNPYCVDVLKEMMPKSSNYIILHTKIEDCDTAALKNYRFDTILCMNVLEHIENDISVLKSFEEILSTEGKVVLLVPAMPVAFGPIDQAVGHFRRYTARTMKKALAETNLKLQTIYYTNFLGFWGWLFNAKVRRSVRQNEGQIQLFDSLVPILSILEKIIHPPIGLSLITVAIKEE